MKKKIRALIFWSWISIPTLAIVGGISLPILNHSPISNFTPPPKTIVL